jgi:anti-sigma-K factor RskA
MSEGGAVPDLTCDEVRELAGAFVLGALDAREEAAVRAHLASHPDGHDEIAELGGVLPVLAVGVPVVEPPEGLKARIMAAAAEDLATRSASPVSTPTPTPTPFPDADAREARRTRTSTGSWVLRIAAVVAIVALGALNLLLQVQLNAAQSYEEGVAAVIDVAVQPGSLTAILTADGGTGSGLAAVSATGVVTLAMQALTPTTGNQVYEAWVIAGDGAPVPLGSFKVGRAGTAFFEGSGLPTANGIVLALTLEPGPGATTPTMPIISKGVAKPAAG